MNCHCCQITLQSETFLHNRHWCEVLTEYLSLGRWPPERIRDIGQKVLQSSFKQQIAAATVTSTCSSLSHS